MSLQAKSQWVVTASSGEPRRAVDDLYASSWVSSPSSASWLQIDLGEVSVLGGVEVYWGHVAAEVYGLESSCDGQVWAPLCRTRHGEGGQNVFAFPPVAARYLRLAEDHQGPDRALEIVEINVYPPEQALSVREVGRLASLGHAPVTLLPGDSITVDFGYVRSPLGALIEWGETWGTVFSVHLSDDGEAFREVGRITTSHGDYDNFYWRSTTSRYFRLTVHEASSPAGAVITELKLRILNKDRMPIGQLERAALAGRSDLYPQSLLGRQVYWTALGEPGHGDQALFDEYGNLEPRPAGGQITPLLRLDGLLYGAPAAGESLSQSLAEGSLPIPQVRWRCQSLEMIVTALAHEGAAVVEYVLCNVGDTPKTASLVLAFRPVQINPYWQHGGHANINAIEVEGQYVRINDLPAAAFSQAPTHISVTDFGESGDVVGLIDSAPRSTPHVLRSGSGLLSAAVEFCVDLQPGGRAAVVLSAPMREAEATAIVPTFDPVREQLVQQWRQKLGPRKIRVGDPIVSDTVEAQIGLILVNATRYAFKPGPRNYDRTWIRDGSSQALALLWAGLVSEAQEYVLWYAGRIYDNGMVPPILNPDGTVNRGYGSDIEFDAQGEFVTIAADTYRITRDRAFLEAIFEPVVRATRFIDELCDRTNALYGPDTRFYGLLAPSISHEGYNKPVYSYWDDFFAVSAWRNCEFLAGEIGDEAMAAHARRRGGVLAHHLARSIRMTADSMGRGLMPASADREDVDPTSTSIAYEPCRVDDLLPPELISATYDDYVRHLEVISQPGFDGGFTPYEIRNLNALVAQGRQTDAFRLLRDSLTWQRPAGWRHWAEVVWGHSRAPEYIGDMPHTWIGAEFATAVRRMLLRENGTTLELFRAVPDVWWDGEGIGLDGLPTGFGVVTLSARRDTGRVTVDLVLTAGSAPAPEVITVHCPGVRSAQADGQPCPVEDDRVMAPLFSRLLIETA